MTEVKARLTKYDRLILAELSENGGFYTGQVSGMAPIFAQLGRMNSAWVRNRLLTLQASGLVGVLDDLKPVCWIRTPAGTRVLNEATL